MECLSFLQPRLLRVTSPLQCTGERRSREARRFLTSSPWRAFCPNCSRPVDIQLRAIPREKPTSEQRHAYVITLWGESPSYILGALVLGRSLRKVGSTKDLVVLHTKDVVGVELLRRTGWITREVEHVESATKLFSDPLRGRFDRVFTKLHALSLTEYDKVCMLDIDMLVLQNIDDVFDLPAPAAMRRGQAHIGYTCAHGEEIPGESIFFGGNAEGQNVEVGADWQTWGQGSGINAGMMVLSPDAEVYRNMIAEVADPNHPSHVAGNGPEQDYLSRYYADQWRHISIEYNFQLHQLYFALHPKDQDNSVRARLCRQGLSRIKVIHYSGDKGLKPWDYVSQEEKPPKNLDDFVETVLEGFQGYMLWSLQDRETWEYLMKNDHFSIKYLEYHDGKIYWKDGEEAVIPDDLKVAARQIVFGSFEQWVAIFDEVEAELGMSVMKELSEQAPTDVSTSGSNQASESTVCKISRIKSKWTLLGRWWAVLPRKLKSDEYRLVTSADELSLFMVFPEGTFRTTSAPILAAQVPRKPVELYCAAELLQWLDSIPHDAFVSIAMKQPSREVLVIVNTIGATFPLEDEEVLCAYYACSGMRGGKFDWDWNCIVDSQIAVANDTVLVPAELMSTVTV